jgi:hypothetical protein
MPTAFEKISTVTITNTTTATVTFSDIPTTYGHLLCLSNMATDMGGATGAMPIRYNGNSSSIYGFNYFTGNSSNSSFIGASINSDFAWGLYVSNGNSQSGVGGGTNFFSNSQFYFPAYKQGMSMMQSITVGGAHNNAGTTMQTGAHSGGSWNNTATVSSISFPSANGNYIQGSLITLYGIKIT